MDERTEREDLDERAAKWEQRFTIPVIAAAVATVPLLILEQSNPSKASGTWYWVAHVGDWVVWSIFAVELVVMLAVVPSRWQYLREHPIDVAIVVLTPPFLQPAVQSARVLRLLRLLRLAPLLKRTFSLEGLRYATVIALALLVGGAEAFASVEKVPIGDGVYWALGTMTTVGYGDITPKTDTGKIVACTLMIAGIGFFALITGAIAQRFLETDVEEIEAGEEDIAEQLRLLREEVGTLQAAIGRRAEDLGP